MPEEEFGKIQKDRTEERKYWADVIKNLQPLPEGSYVPANNHYAVYGPAAANTFRGMLGMSKVTLEDMKQTTLD